MRGLFSGGAMLWWTFIVFCFTGLPLAAVLMTLLRFQPMVAVGIGLMLAVFLAPYLAIKWGERR